MSVPTLSAPDRTTRALPTCKHCGAPLIDERMRASGFCCAGCSYVYRLVHEHGLAGYYNIKDGVTAPADAVVFQPRDFSWLQSAQDEAEAGAPAVPSLLLSVQGISCAGCVWLIERVFQQQPGARDIEANAQLGQVRLRWIPGQFSAADFARKLQSFGYLLGPAHAATPPSEARALVKRIGLCAAFAMNIMLFAFPAYFGMEPTFAYARLFDLLALGFGTLSFLVGGTYFIGRAWRALREGAMHIDLPIAVGIVGAYSGSLYGWFAGEHHFVYFDFVGTFVLLMLVGRWAQVAAVERNQRRLLAQQPTPQRVRLATGADVPPEQLRPNQDYVAAAGQTVPVESRLGSAEAQFSLASINGEAAPREFRAGQRVPAGAINVGRTAVSLTSLQAWDESLLAQLLRPGERQSARHMFLEKIVRGYLIGIFGIALAAGLGWWLSTHDGLRTWSVVTAVLVVSCPCAIGLAFPLAGEIATIALRRRGVFVREGDLWSKLGRIRQLVFDKTGTLTLETPVLENPETLDALDDSARAVLFELVRDNPHPVSQSLLENLLARGATPPPVRDAEIVESVGHGVTLTSAGPTWTLGRPGWRSPAPAECHIMDDTGSLAGDVVLARDGAVVAEFRFADRARADAGAELKALQAAGFRTYILSGDRSEKVARLAADLKIPAANAVGELTPQQKADWLSAHGADESLMLGDGANDSLAFDRALCRGTPVIHRGILEQKADFYYLGRGLGGLRALFAINSLRRRTEIWVLVFSVAYNALAVGLAVAGQMNPLVAAILMPINSLLTLALVTGGMRRAFR